MSQGREQVAGVAKLLMAGDHSQSVGMGIVVDERHVVTCAHVVNSALGQGFEVQDKPDEKIAVAFPYAGPEAVDTCSVILWHPMGQDRDSDIAVLELDENVPEGAGIGLLVSDNELEDHTFKAFGFREGSIKGNNVAGRFMGPLPDGTVQIDGIGEQGIFIESGFSGAGVWDTTLRAVVGMVSSRNINPAERVAYMIPVRALKQTWPPLQIPEKWPPVPIPGQAGRNRMNMIEKVRKIWITGFLQKSLSYEVPILPNLIEQPDAVAPPMGPVVQSPDRRERSLPPATRVVHVYDEMDQALLILGAPGSGKTTLLLELCRDLLGRAKRDTNHPIPVVFPLSTWGESRRPLAEWLADELNLRYDVPRKIAQEWVNMDQVLPLLDGLDEVKAAHRAACVEAINEFRKSHGFLPLVVCSRTEDYQALGVKLRLQGAVAAQPLTAEQVVSYLNEAGAAGQAVQRALCEDPSLWELLDAPLMLNIITAAHEDRPNFLIPIQGTSNERRTRLFGAYVDQMFHRRGVERRYTPGQAVHWLGWLAGQMVNHGQTVFVTVQSPFWHRLCGKGTDDR